MRLFLICSIFAVATPADARRDEQRVIGVETRIPNAANGGIRNFVADGSDGLFIQDKALRWYRVTVGTCPGLQFATELGYYARGYWLDKDGAIIVDGVNCPIVSVKTAENPMPPGETRVR